MDDDDRYYSGDPADLVEALGQLLERPSWHQHAACRGAGTDAFFTAEQTPYDALRYCVGCEARYQCMRAGMSEPAGTWGGMTAKERAHERRYGAA